MPANDKITSDHVFQAIKNKFSDPQRYAVMSEVNCGTGYAAKSWIDALVISLWPSDGLHRIAFEIKVSRADFLSEMEKHAKNEFFREHCHEFWYATAKDVVKSEDEIPEGCGWMCMRGKDTLVRKKQAQRRADVLNDDMFVASIARSCFNAKGLQRHNLEQEIQSTQHYKDMANTQEAVRKYMAKKGESHWMPWNKSVDEIVEELTNASVEKEHQNHAQHIELVLNKLRKRFGEFFMDMFMLSKHFLTEIDEEGHYLIDGYGYHKNEDVFPLLRMLYRELKKRNSYNPKKPLREELKFFEEFLERESDRGDKDGK